MFQNSCLEHGPVAPSSMPWTRVRLFTIITRMDHLGGLTARSTVEHVSLKKKSINQEAIPLEGFVQVDNARFGAVQELSPE